MCKCSQWEQYVSLNFQMPIVNLYYFDRCLHVDLLSKLLHIWKLYILLFTYQQNVWQPAKQTKQKQEYDIINIIRQSVWYKGMLNTLLLAWPMMGGNPRLQIRFIKQYMMMKKKKHQTRIDDNCQRNKSIPQTVTFTHHPNHFSTIYNCYTYNRYYENVNV